MRLLRGSRYCSIDSKFVMCVAAFVSLSDDDRRRHLYLHHSHHHPQSILHAPSSRTITMNNMNPIFNRIHRKSSSPPPAPSSRPWCPMASATAPSVYLLERQEATGLTKHMSICSCPDLIGRPGTPASMAPTSPASPASPASAAPPRAPTTSGAAPLSTLSASGAAGLEKAHCWTKV